MAIGMKCGLKKARRHFVVVMVFTSLFVLYFTRRSNTRYGLDESDADQHLHEGSVSMKEQSAKLILLTSYKRSGSTFLGAVMGWHDESFYWVEPLMSRYENQFIYPEGFICHYKRPDCELRSHDAFKQELQAMYNGIDDIYNCAFSERYDWVKALHAVQTSKLFAGPSWEKYRNCTDPDKSRCLRRLVPVCMNSRYRVMKELRMDLRLSSQLLMKLPTLKMIHLFRDPRGQLNSHIHTKWYQINEYNIKHVEYDVLALCDRMRKDIQTAKRLLKEFPDRFRVVQYEDFDNLVDKTRRIYEFLGMTFDDKAKALMNTLRPKSGREGFHPFSYRNSLRWQSVNLVNKHCSDIYKELGYTLFNTETDLRNHSIRALSGPMHYSI